MRSSNPGIHLLGALAFGFITVGVAGRLHAQPITLGAGSTVNATADDYSDPTSSNDVTGLPYTNTTSVSEGNASSSVLATLSISSFNFAFTQSIVADSYTEGDGDMYFTAGANATFSIAGYETITGSVLNLEEVVPNVTPSGEGELVTYLYDLTQETYVYDYDQTTGIPEGIAALVSNIAPVDSNTLTLDTSGGSLSGGLTAGDSYEFYTSEDMNDVLDPTVTGNVAITFAQSLGSAVPLPSSAPAALLPLLLAGFLVRRSAWLKA